MLDADAKNKNIEMKENSIKIPVYFDTTAAPVAADVNAKIAVVSRTEVPFRANANSSASGQAASFAHAAVYNAAGEFARPGKNASDDRAARTHRAARARALAGTQADVSDAPPKRDASTNAVRAPRRAAGVAAARPAAPAPTTTRS